MPNRPPALTRRPPTANSVPLQREALPSLPRPFHLLALGQAAVLAALPHGGQRVAHRNAWAGMSADSARGRAQREADAAVDDAVRRAETRGLAAPGEDDRTRRARSS